MKTFAASTILTTLSLLSATNAATVTLQTTQSPCFSSTEIEPVTFTVTLDELHVQALSKVCGIEVLSASGIAADAVNCMAYRDAAGTQPGSAIFNTTAPALIATNPVQEGSIKCWAAHGASSSLISTSLATITARGTAPIATVSGTGAVTLSPSNATVTRVSSATLSASSTLSTSTGTGAASQVTGLGFMAGLAGIAAMVL